MKTKKEIKKDLEIKKIVNKRRNFILYIVLILLLLVLLADIIVFYQAFNKTYTSIKDDKGRVLTTEFCTHWFNLTIEERNEIKETSL